MIAEYRNRYSEYPHSHYHISCKTVPVPIWCIPSKYRELSVLSWKCIFDVNFCTFLLRFCMVNLLLDEVSGWLRPAPAERSLRLPHVSLLLYHWLDGHLPFQLGGPPLADRHSNKSSHWLIGILTRVPIGCCNGYSCLIYGSGFEINWCPYWLLCSVPKRAPIGWTIISRIVISIPTKARLAEKLALILFQIQTWVSIGRRF